MPHIFGAILIPSLRLISITVDQKLYPVSMAIAQFSKQQWIAGVLQPYAFPTVRLPFWNNQETGLRENVQEKTESSQREQVIEI